MNKMENIFHEKQEGALCAQHCLNSLLQGSYYNAVNLAEIAKELDEVEREAMAMGDVNSPEYLEFIQQPSSNFDDSGYFSVQVICRALQFWSLQMIPFNSQAAESSRSNPTFETAYICNQQNHWLTIRKIGKQWFNLNSMKSCPELISDTYLSLLLEQLRTEGYSIFIISGDLPQCEADVILQNHTVTVSEYKQFVENERNSRNNANKTDKEKQEKAVTIDTTPAIPVDAADVRTKRMNYFLNKQIDSSKQTEIDTGESSGNNEAETSRDTNQEETKPANRTEKSEEEMLQLAISMSMEPML